MQQIYQISKGDQTEVAFDHTGPKHYTQGGEPIYASDIGFAAGIGWMQAAYWSINQNTGNPNYVLQILWPFNSFLQVPMAHLVWYVQATGQEAAAGTDLSLEHVRMTAVGN